MSHRDEWKVGRNIFWSEISPILSGLKTKISLWVSLNPRRFDLRAARLMYSNGDSQSSTEAGSWVQSLHRSKVGRTGHIPCSR